MNGSICLSPFPTAIPNNYFPSEFAEMLASHLFLSERSICTTRPQKYKISPVLWSAIFKENIKIQNAKNTKYLLKISPKKISPKNISTKYPLCCDRRYLKETKKRKSTEPIICCWISFNSAEHSVCRRITIYRN